MKQYPIKRKCKSCKGMAILMPPQKQEDGSVNPKEAYYYHYSQYSDCRQRMDVKSKLLGQWRNKDEIRNLSELLTTERKRTKNTISRDFARTGWMVSGILCLFMGLIVLITLDGWLKGLIVLLLALLMGYCFAVSTRLKNNS